MKTTIRITLIVDNTVGDGLLAEHGFAAWIEAGDDCYLFDTGQGAALLPNARQLGIDLGHADALVLSHGHYDHVGALPEFVAVNRHAVVYHARGASVERYSCHAGQPAKALGMNAAVLAALVALPAGRRVEVDGARYLGPGIGISGPITRLTQFEDAGGPFYFDAERQQPDPIGDDLALWFETGDGLVVLTGCCHSGLVNTLTQIRRLSGVERIAGIIGGLHLLNASEQRVEATLRFIADCAPDFVVPCHCTGAQVVERMQRQLAKDMVTPGRAGLRLDAGTLAR